MERRSRLIALVGIAAGVAVLLIVLVQVYRAATTSPREAFRGSALLPERDAPEMRLVDQTGKSAPLIDPAARATFLFFGFTHCKDTCPLALAKLAQAYRKMSNARAIRVEMVTVDPARDDPAALRRFVTHFDPRFIGLTGEKRTLETLWSKFDVLVDTRTHDVVHGDAIYLVDGRRRVLAVYLPEVDPADLAHDAQLL